MLAAKPRRRQTAIRQFSDGGSVTLRRRPSFQRKDEFAPDVARLLLEISRSAKQSSECGAHEREKQVMNFRMPAHV